MSDSAEAIAKVVADLRKRRVYDRYEVQPPEGMWLSMEQSIVVDATAIYRDLLKRKGVMVYEDHRAAAVWENAMIGYHNDHGNAIVMHTIAMDRSKYDDTEWEHQAGLWVTDAPTHEIDWDRVRWVYNITIFAGGRQGNGEPVPTTGPCYMYRMAVYPDGEIADIRWIAFDAADHGEDHHPWKETWEMGLQNQDRWQMAQLTVLGAINLGNCVNVELREPTRPRAAQRRLARSGVEVTEIHVRPISASYRGKKREAVAFGSVPLHSVRGHFAEYGVNGRGLLFGKYSGRYWIPAHARGSSEHGEIEQSYVVEA